MRILVVHNRYTMRGGEDAVVDAEVASLRARGHDVLLVEAANEDVPTHASLAKRVRMGRRAVWSREQARSVASTARAFAPDIAHVHNHAYELSASIFPALAASGATVVQTLHNYRMTCANAYLLRNEHPCELCVGSRASWQGVRYGCFRGSRTGSMMIAAMQLAWRRSAIANVSCFIVLTEFARSMWERAGVPSNQLVVRPNTIADPGFDGSTRREDAPVLFVGRLESSKGVGVLAQAWGQDGCGGAELVIAGAGSDPAPAGRGIHAVGAQSPAQVAELMAKARVLVVPSTWYEGFPMVVLEAMAAGTPVIASDLGSLREIVRDEVGWRVPAGDPRALRAAIEHAVASPGDAERRGAAARQAFEQRYAQGIVMSQLEDIYRAALRSSD